MTTVHADGRTTIEQLTQRLGALETEFSTWEDHLRLCNEYIMPRTGRFFVDDSNKGDRRNASVIDNTATRANRVLGAGLVAGMSSPHQLWFRLRTADPHLNRQHHVREYLDEVVVRTMRVLDRSNLYRVFHQMYEELGAYGTAACIIEKHDTNVVHAHALTIGQFFIASDPNGRVNTIYRKFRLTIAQLVKKFGMENVSDTARRLAKNGQLESYRDVVHAIEPREDRDTRKKDKTNAPFRSIYFERGENIEDTSILRESGYRVFPAVVPRWALTPGDVMGNGPGMEALGDIIQLQDQQLWKGRAIAYKVRPSLQLPTDLKNTEVEADPGGENFTDATGAGGGIRPAWEVGLDLGDLREDIADVRTRINASFYADLFLMLYQSQDTARRTATEVAELHSEKLLVLGPALERLDTEMLEPAIHQVLVHMEEAGELPEPPEELAGHALLPEFVSVLAQAQRAAGINSIDRFISGVGAVAEYKPEALDKIDIDAWVDEMAERLGVPPQVTIPTSEAAEIRIARNEKQKAQEQAEMAGQVASAAKDAAAAEAQAPVDSIGMFSGLEEPPV